MPRQSTAVRPETAAAKGSTEVVSFIGPQSAPRLASRRRSMWCMPAKLRTAMPPSMMMEARSPLTRRWDSAQSPVPQRKGWRVTERMPTAGDPGALSRKRSPPTSVGLGLVRPATSRIEASGMTSSGTQARTGAGCHTATKGAAR